MPLHGGGGDGEGGGGEYTGIVGGSGGDGGSASQPGHVQAASLTQASPAKGRHMAKRRPVLRKQPNSLSPLGMQQLDGSPS